MFTNSTLKLIKVFNAKELADIKQGLVLAMKRLDEFPDNTADSALSNRLEVIFESIDKRPVHPIEAMYLDYVNNFLTSARFAEHYGISNQLAGLIILEGSNLYKEDR